MSWTRRLRVPITLKDGTRLITLSDARQLIMSLPELHVRNPDWQLAGDLLLAASGGDQTAFDKVGIQLRIALKKEGLILGCSPSVLEAAQLADAHSADRPLKKAAMEFHFAVVIKARRHGSDSDVDPQ
jgi:hypothetical protein